MDFITAVKTCFKKYFVFSGRARRSEYWFWILFTIIVSIPLSIIDAFAFSGMLAEIGPLDSTFSLLTLIPGLAVAWRRLHDIGRSGWWYGGPLLVFVVLGGALGAMIGFDNFDSNFENIDPTMIAMFMGLIIAVLVWAVTLIVFTCMDSQDGTNKYGPNPKTGSEANAFD